MGVEVGCFMIDSSVYRDLTYWKVTNYIFKQLLNGYSIEYFSGIHGIYSYARGDVSSQRFVKISEIINSETGLDA